MDPDMPLRPERVHMDGVTFQVNLAPTDLPHLGEILAHQLRQWAAQVDEVLLVVDLHTSRGLQAAKAPEQLAGLRRLVDELARRYPHLRSVDVDYSDEARAQVSDRFFGGVPVPLKDWRAAPIYPYFYGLDAASYSLVFHNDSDMLYGGGSQAWIAEAVALLTERDDVLACSPLPGPPTEDGGLRSQTLPRERYSSLAYRSDSLSTRVLMIDLERFRTKVVKLTASVPVSRQRLMALVDGNPQCETAEIILSNGMAAAGLHRVDFLGAEPGMWSIHPPYRSSRFYGGLSELVDRIERGDVAEAQRGDHEVNDSMVDWSDVRQSRSARWTKHGRLLVRNLTGADH